MVILTIHDRTSHLVPDPDLDDHAPDHMEEIIQLRKVTTIRSKAVRDTSRPTGNLCSNSFLNV